MALRWLFKLVEFRKGKVLTVSFRWICTEARVRFQGHFMKAKISSAGVAMNAASMSVGGRDDGERFLD
jgi:hypothetical protein